MIIDFRNCRKGHSVSLFQATGQPGEFTGCMWVTPAPQVGDQARINMKSGQVGVAEIIKVKPDQPEDMYWVTIRFTHYLSDE